MRRLRRWGLALLLAGLASSALADIGFRKFYDEDDESAKPKWQEEEFALPEFPKDESLIEFYVSAGTANRFFVDGTSISRGKDGVVRFTLVVRMAGGSTNITYEGIRCENIEHRIYATGRTDGTWTKARISAWKRIENKPINRHHAALSRDFFCPSGEPINDAEEGRDALRRGKHPRAA